MEQQTNLKLIGTTPKFVEEAMNTLEGAMKYADIILKAKLCPHHFFERKKEGDRWVPDFDKGNPSAILQVIQHGSEVGLTISQSLQQIVPVNGLMSIKGDGAKSLIFRSGKLKDGSWKEETQGSIHEGNYRVKISATRSDNGESLSREFSVEMAKRAGLWVTEADTQHAQYGRAKRASSWWKYPDRMIKYRALGFLARDLFPDVMMGMITQEEAVDYPIDTQVTIETPAGERLELPDPQHSQSRSDQLTGKAVDKIDKNLKSEISPDQAPAIPGTKKIEMAQEKVELIRKLSKYTEDTYMKMGAKIYKIADQLGITDKIEADPARKSNKKYRLAIMKYVENLGDYVVEKIEPTVKENGSQDQESGESELKSESFVMDPGHSGIKNLLPDNGPEDPEVQKFQEEMGDQGPEEPKEVPTNKYELLVPDVQPNGLREFSDKKALFHALSDEAIGIDDKRYLEICELHELVTEDGEKFINAYPTKEKFCEEATIVEINQLLELN